VVIPAPYWVSYPEMARMAGAEPVIVDTALEEGFLLTPKQLAAALSPRARVLILCSPSNPTGTVYDEARLRVRPAPPAAHPYLCLSRTCPARACPSRA